MRIELDEKPVNVTVIEGFPGFGLVGTITTEFLIDHLKAKKIGKIISEDISPVVAVHDSKVVEPLGIFYDKKNKIIILHSLISVAGLEWDLSEIIKDLSKRLKAKEIISVEGVASVAREDNKLGVYYLSENKKKWEKIGTKELKEGIVMGVTGALLLERGVTLSCVFAETRSKLPDSRASAKVIEVLDKYLGLNVDFAPLLKKAEQFENKVKTLLENSKQAVNKQKRKNMDLDYLG